MLAETYIRHPERFPNGCPVPRALPTAVWINPPVQIPDTLQPKMSLTQKSRKVTIVDPERFCEAALEVNRPENENLIPEDLCTAVVQ